MQSDTGTDYEVHISFTTTGATMLRWVNTMEAISLRWSNTNGATWHCGTWGGYWYAPEAGNYLISFVDEHPNVIFGGGLVSLAETFTKVRIHPEYNLRSLDMENMFKDCKSLVTIDMDVDMLTLSQNHREMFGPKFWDDFSVYQMGDIIVHADQLYVASRATTSTEPGLGDDDWIVLDSAPDSFVDQYTEEVSQGLKQANETREVFGNIKKDIDDIPE